MILAVASGKGGTGKTTVATNLARVADAGVQLLDCDVEAPNDHLFLPGEAVAEEVVGIAVPSVDVARCDGCGDCSDICQFHAIVVLGGTPLVFPELCHGCGGCTWACTRGAIVETAHRVGQVTTTRARGVELVEGRLDVGVAMAPPVIRAVKARRRSAWLTILDAPPGTTCPVVTTIRGSDVVMLVTEPTPFGLHDLELAVAMVSALDIPCGVVINRAGSGDQRVQDHCERVGIPILAEIPDDRRIAVACSRGELLVDTLPQYRTTFTRLLERVLDLSGRESAKEASP